MRFVSLGVCAVSCFAFSACPPPNDDGTPQKEKEPLPFAAADGDNAPDPAIEGPYPVGVRSFVLVDDLREEPLDPADPDGPKGPRTLKLEVWYPAKEAARDDDKESIQLFDALPPDLQEGLTPEDLGTLATIAVRDAAARDDGDVYPVVLFSHGKGGIRLQSNYYTAFLASHGYVVVAPDHTGDTIVELLREVKEEGAIQPDSTLEAIVDRPKDMIAILDLLDDVLTDQGSPELAALTDLERVGITGHSFGALTSFLVVTMDARIDVVIGQTPVSQDVIELQQQTPLGEINKPMFLQSSTQDDTLPEDTNARPLYETLTGEKGWLSLARGGHFTYSDLCVLDVAAISAAIELDVSNVLDDGCGPEAIPSDVAFPAIRSSAIGAFNLHLRASTGSKAFLSQGELDKLAAGEGTYTYEP